jgi:hypothetical protein
VGMVGGDERVGYCCGVGVKECREGVGGER